jgi:hypothetical protein
MTRSLSIALAAVAPVVLSAAVLIGTTPDEEEFRFAVLASTLHATALADARWPWWTPALGLGIPQPLVPNFNMHPLLPLLTLMSPVAWVRLFYVAHTIFGAIGMWRLGGDLRLGGGARAACVFSFMLATPTQNYVLVDFWPSHYLVWTCAPWLLVLAWRFAAASGRELWRYTLLLGACAGLVLANTNPGHVVVYATVTATVVWTHWRGLLARWRCAACAALLALAISSPNHVQLALERSVFSADLTIVKTPDAMPRSAAWDAFLRPLRHAGESWQADVIERGPRTVFFGGPFAVLALCGLWLGRRRHPDLVLGVFLSTTLLFTAFVPITFASRFHFRDPLTLCAIPLAGITLDMVLRSSRFLGTVLLIGQIAVVGLAVWPVAAVMLEPEAREAAWFRGATGRTPMATALRALMREPGRLAFSPQVDAEVSARARLFDGLGINALGYHGISVVNGSFKGVSTDVVWPDDRLFYGRIRLPSTLIRSDVGLDLLGIRYVLANPGEPVAEGLVERGTVEKRDKTSLLLYENIDAWRRAFLVRGDAAAFNDLPRQQECSNDRLLCRDFTSLGQARLPVAVAFAQRDGEIALTFEAQREPHVMVLSEMFRPAWTARTADATLPTVSVGPGLLAVEIPPNVGDVRVEYRPLMLQAATAASGIAVALAAVALLWLARVRRVDVRHISRVVSPK